MRWVDKREEEGEKNTRGLRVDEVEEGEGEEERKRKVKNTLEEEEEGDNGITVNGLIDDGLMRGQVEVKSNQLSIDWSIDRSMYSVYMNKKKEG